MFGIYLFLKFMIFFAIVKALVRFETLQNHFLFLGILYTGIVAFISYVFVVSVNPSAFSYPWVLQLARMTGVSPWLVWVGLTLVISTLYFKLLSRFDEGTIFWILLVLGIPIALF